MTTVKRCQCLLVSARVPCPNVDCNIAPVRGRGSVAEDVIHPHMDREAGNNMFDQASGLHCTRGLLDCSGLENDD